MNDTLYDLGIAGGGIVGLSVAWYARRQGLSVLIVDEPRQDQAATPASAGVVWPLEALSSDSMFWPWVRRALDHYEAFIESLELDDRSEVQFTHPGLLRLDGCESNLRPGEALVAQGDLPEWPQLSGAWAKAARRVCPARLQDTLRKRLIADGVSIVDATLQHVPEGEKWVTTAGEFSCKRSVISTGAWKLGGVRVDTALKPIRGQMLELQLTKPWTGPMLQFEDTYMLPLGGGKVMIGSTVEDVGFDAATTKAGREHILRSGQPILDLLGEYQVTRHWAGLRPRIGDGLQAVIGRIMSQQNVAVVLGMYRLGVTTAPAIGKAFANWAAGREELPLVGT